MTRTIGIIFFSALLVLLGVAMISLSIGFSFDSLQPQCLKLISDMIFLVQQSAYGRIILGIAGIVLIISTLSFAQALINRFQREKNIAFSTSSGEVTIALSAVEDLVRRLTSVLPEIKELRPDVIARKGTIIADLKVVLKAETNIPELTARLQEIARNRIQEVLGVDEQVIVKIHVAKIISSEDKRKKDNEKNETTIPFGSFR